jgi:subtilase family serine protease
MAKMIKLEISRRMQLPVCGVAAACFMLAASLGAQSVAPRIPSDVGTAQLQPIAGSLNPLAQSKFEAGRLLSSTRLNGMTIVFNRSAAQEADLKALIAAQQNPASPSYHQWLTPDQFAARFGMADSDLSAVESWLQQQGFAIDSVTRSRNAIHFSGTSSQVEQAFSTEMHYYNIGGAKHFAPSTALSVPSAIAPVVTAIRNLDDFRPKPMHIRSPRPQKAKPSYSYCGDQACTTANQGVFFAPGDIKLAYDINPLLSSGYSGTGQTIAIMGQSEISTTDITNFQDAAGLTEKAPTTTLVPNTGSSAFSQGDESESDIDLEWSGAIATGATINLVYTGSNQNDNVFNSFEYAVDNQIGNIISLSYGDCETDLGQTDFTALEQFGEQATAQGQTVIASSGDSGATSCYGFTNLTKTQQAAPTVDYPASSVYVTGIGGTENPAADDVAGSTYWTAVSSSSSTGILLESATQWIPEVAWNDDAYNIGLYNANNVNCSTNYLCLSAGGGGYSAFAAQPSWQTDYFVTTGYTNPQGGSRLVPDISLYASPYYPGYLYCTSDQSSWSSGQSASCGASEFYDDVTSYFTVAGGTSFGAPIFAGMVAILNQAKGYNSGQGLINTELYKLAADSTTYASAFHDVTSGNNECTAASDCPSSSGYSTGTGYDVVTGLGSVNLDPFVTAWPTSNSTAVGTTVGVSATTTTPNVGASDTITVTVSPDTGTTAPTGTVEVTIGGTAVSGSPFTLTTSGTASSVSFSHTFTTAGTYTVTASYVPTDSALFAANTGTLSVTAEATSSGTGTIKVAATPSAITVAQGSAGTENITVTGSTSPAYTGTVDLTLDFGSSDTSLGNLCAGFGTSNSAGDGVITISAAGTPESTTLILDTNSPDCVTANAVKRTGMRPLRVLLGKGAVAQNNSKPNLIPEGVAFAGMLLIGFLGRRSRKLRGLVAILLLATVGLAISACSGGSTSTTISDPPKGTYTGTISAQDSTTSTITATTTFTFVID